MASTNSLVLEVPLDDSSEIQKAKKIPRRILHFSDGTLEEYSTDDEGVEPKVTKRDIQEVNTMDPKTLEWSSWFWYQTVMAGTKTLEVCDYLGESLASFFGITTPKYQFEIDTYRNIMAEEEKLKKEQDLEMAGWTTKSAEEKSNLEDTISEPPCTQRY